ncbi:hypothetical protein [Nitrosospira briensis]|uniref:hypothetical protein n=1 Tax=Nitrosospira briensis TaxID=35799 RepID=UPI00046819EE|nr:hypothetical protein [Nitrosospira briensis]
MDFALQSQGYERQQGSIPGEVGLERLESEDGDEGQLDSKADCSFWLEFNVQLIDQSADEIELWLKLTE